ncbi:MAG: Ldh family oxidoreductase, partial [Planctomycetaceae bacterium]
MPVLNSAQLFSLAERILQAADVDQTEARIVAEELRQANLVGHDSHGVMRLMQYVANINDGHIRPGAEFEIVREAGGYAVVDGHFNFGQVTTNRALELGIQKATAAGTATIAVRNCNHVGRLGSYSHRAAERDLVCVMVANAPGPGGVAPYGGIERRLGTNPVTMAAPCHLGPIVLDMTTSATAEGKLRVAHQKGESVPEGMIMDGHGRPSTDPADYYADPPGALLPLGGPLGFKGFGLSVMVDVLGGMLSGSGVCRTDLPRGANGVWMYLADPEVFSTRAEFDALMTA